MPNKVRVYGKAQNRTALGIMHAYMVMYPHATFEDLKKAFPDSLNPDSGVKVNFTDQIKNASDEWKGFFLEPEELLTMGDGKKVAVVSMWTKPSFERLVDWAKQYGIEVAKFEKAEKGFGKKGGYELEYLNGYVPPVPAGTEKKKTPWWWFLLGALALLLLLLLLLKGCNKEPKVVTVVQKDTVTVVKTDTVYMQAFEEIEKNFNAAEFKANSAELSESAKFVLHDLAKLMEKHPEVKLKIVGHTSEEGDKDFNQKLSEKRAQAAVDFLISQGVDKDKLEAEGKGSSEPLEPGNHEKNRRTEFIVLTDK